jgi:hypothetical protein
MALIYRVLVQGSICFDIKTETEVTEEELSKQAYSVLTPTFVEGFALDGLEDGRVYVDTVDDGISLALFEIVDVNEDDESTSTADGEGVKEQEGAADEGETDSAVIEAGDPPADLHERR